MQKNIKNRTIFCDDNLDIMYGFDTESIDLIYLDPPFNKKKIFTAPIGSSAEGASFPDIFGEEDVKEEWLKTIKEDYFSLHELLSAVKNIEGRASSSFCYLAYMAVRLMECHRILKDTGSIYLHCDSTMSHYLKLLLDCIFGEKNFRNEVVWCYENRLQRKAKTFSSLHDVVYLYTKSNNFIFNQIGNESWKPSNTQKRRLKKGYEIRKGVLIIYDNEKFKTNSINLKDYKKVSYSKASRPPIGDFWNIPILNPMAKERVGYPTQKPLKLLERIIKASSNEGDTVLDPFCGCATTCVAAERLGRKWIGIDVSQKAYELVKERLEQEVEWKGSLFEESLVTFRTDPPNRIDRGKDYIQKKSVYILFHPKHKGYKVGVASDVKSRLNSYQTGDPQRQYQLKYSLLTPYFREIEKYIHDKYENMCEWVMGDLEVIKKDIEAKHEALDRS